MTLKPCQRRHDVSVAMTCDSASTHQFQCSTSSDSPLVMEMTLAHKLTIAIPALSSCHNKHPSCNLYMADSKHHSCNLYMEVFILDFKMEVCIPDDFLVL